MGAYSGEQLAFVREMASRGMSDRLVSEAFNERYGAKTTRNSISMLRRSHGIPTGVVTCDQWGGRVVLSPAALPLLSERREPSGYVRVKVRMLRTSRANDMWVPRGVLEWERSHGQSLPDGMRVVHANGVRDDDRPENLVAMTVAEYAMIHGSGWEYSDAAQLESLVAMARVLLRANELEGEADPDAEHKRRLAAQRRSRARRRGEADA